MPSGDRDAVERLAERDLRDGFAGFHLEDAHFVLAPTAVQHRGKHAAGMQRDVDRKIADAQLPADRAQRPLVGQQHGAVELKPGQDRGGLRPQEFEGAQARETH